MVPPEVITCAVAVGEKHADEAYVTKAEVVYRSVLVRTTAWRLAR
jgi:hypothetical protein